MEEKIINEEELKNIEKRIISVVEKFNLKETHIYKITNEVFSAMKKMKKNENISLKQFFEKKQEISYEEILLEIENLYKNNATDVQTLINDVEKIFIISEEKEILINISNQPVTKYHDNKLRKFMYKRFPWATDSINDFIDLKQLFNYNIDSNYLDTLMSKMIFKESYSLIDRLKTEASLELGKKNANLEEKFDYTSPKTMLEETDKLRNIPHQDILFNQLFIFLTPNMPFLKEFDVDDDGWVSFVYDDLEKIISTKINLFYKDLTKIRNNFEHSWPTDFSQFFYMSGIIDNQHIKGEDRQKITNYWNFNYLRNTIMFLYFLIKLDLLVNNKTI